MAEVVGWGLTKPQPLSPVLFVPVITPPTTSSAPKPIPGATSLAWDPYMPTREMCAVRRGAVEARVIEQHITAVLTDMQGYADHV